jgi:hypothetical protein
MFDEAIFMVLPAISNNLIEMTQADKPNSPAKKYRLV